MIDADKEATVGSGSYFGKLFLESQAVPAVVSRDWRFGLLRRVYPYALLVFDLLLIAGLFWLMLFLRTGELSTVILSKQVLAVLMVTSVVGIYLVGGYSYQTKYNSARFVSEYLLVAIFSGITAISISYAFITYGSGVAAARGAVIPALLAFPLFSGLYRYRLEWVKSRRRQQRAICILGSSSRSLDLLEAFRAQGHHEGVVVYDEFGDSQREDVRESFAQFGAVVLPLSDFNPMANAVGGRQIENVILAMRLEEMEEEMVKQLICSHSRRNQVVTLESYVLNTFRYVPTHEVSPSWAFGEGFRINSSLVYNRAKRFLDFSVALLGLVVVSPLLLAIALVVRLTSRGPVLFCQERIGRHEQPFTLYKFRTMVEGAEKHGDYTAERDSRVTGVGKFLRKSRLDEIPQLWNVVKGDMSLVGPRPEWSKLVEEYENQVRLYHYRHLVRPGITGWAQVCYSYGSGVDDAVAKLKYDLYYVRYYSIVLDLTIVVKTAYTMIFGRGR